MESELDSVESKIPPYPLLLDLHDRLVTLVGAGRVGQRKLAGLLQSGAQVRVVDPCKPLELTTHQGVEHRQRHYRPGDLAGSFLVFACTDNAELNREVVVEARSLGILCCCSTNPAEGDFILPASFSRGHLQVSVSTGGDSPAMAALIRDRLAAEVPDSWGRAVEIIAAVRRKWLTHARAGQYNQQVLRRFWIDQLVPALDADEPGRVDQLLSETFGEAYTLDKLDIFQPKGMT